MKQLMNAILHMGEVCINTPNNRRIQLTKNLLSTRITITELHNISVRLMDNFIIKASSTVHVVIRMLECWKPFCWVTSMHT